MLKRLIIIWALFLPLLAVAQETPNVVVGPVSKQQRTADLKKQKQKEEANKAEAKLVKHQYKLQDKQTRKRMRQSKRESTRINEHKKEFFLKRWFNKKHR